ncbi:glycogen synthase GlgA [Bacillus luteolus]|uniref:Glycogen synthase n=1 Tax=Litchfieldia luteola TaxID=682179 RepID=A0ABR9QIU5_9BACI|nr:glycogen synthase GlgA [Cytobacillus luteolus]MBE4908415.1 glycogen synthase GlgA [Cytobacillus luteolus]MBP1943203.1 starch synthase [Cytobacillus luteolus]
MKVLFVVSECVPFIKSGGLADVAGALPKELKNLGTDVRIMLPKYGQIPLQFKEKMDKVCEFNVQLSWRSQYCGIEVLTYEGITYYFIDNEYYFNRDRLYGYYDDGERFSFFCHAVLQAIPNIDFMPDIIHCHDWHTGMVNFLLKHEYKEEDYSSIRTIFTIHNLQFQGVFPKGILGDLLNLSEEYFTSDQLEFFGNVNFMKAAIVSSDLITTVSPTYKDEIQSKYYGEKLDGLLRKYNDKLVGILNGIDDEIYNPKTDDLIAKKYDYTKMKNKELNKQSLQKQFGLPKRKDIPVVSIISRLTEQKGLDLIIHVIEEMLSKDLQLIILGTGDEKYENIFLTLAHHYPTKLKVVIGFDEKLAHQIYAGSDLFLMPSKFEPCGLGQLIALRYGTIPIVRETGGLNDTVLSYNESTGIGNGFSFKNFNAHDMLYTVDRAIDLFQNREVWSKIVGEAMSRDYSWAQSAFKYNQLYAGLLVRSGMNVHQQRDV